MKWFYFSIIFILSLTSTLETSEQLNNLLFLQSSTNSLTESFLEKLLTKEEFMCDKTYYSKRRELKKDTNCPENTDEVPVVSMKFCYERCKSGFHTEDDNFTQCYSNCNSVSQFDCGPICVSNKAVCTDDFIRDFKTIWIHLEHFYLVTARDAEKSGVSVQIAEIFCLEFKDMLSMNGDESILRKFFYYSQSLVDAIATPALVDELVRSAVNDKCRNNNKLAELAMVSELYKSARLSDKFACFLRNGI